MPRSARPIDPHAERAVDEVRRRVQQDIHGHRGRTVTRCTASATSCMPVKRTAPASGSTPNRTGSSNLAGHLDDSGCGPPVLAGTGPAYAPGLVGRVAEAESVASLVFR